MENIEHYQIWRDKQTLLYLYIQKNLSSIKVSDRIGCSSTTILKWLRKHDIDVRSRKEAQEGTGEVKTIKECMICGTESDRYSDTEKVFCSRECHMRHRRSGPVPFKLEDYFGYPGWSTGTKVHQLLAIANGADPYKVFSGREYNVHHKNGHKIDNRPENIEVIDVGAHGVKTRKQDGVYTHKDLLHVIDFFLNPKI